MISHRLFLAVAALLCAGCFVSVDEEKGADTEVEYKPKIDGEELKEQADSLAIPKPKPKPKPKGYIWHDWTKTASIGDFQVQVEAAIIYHVFVKSFRDFESDKEYLQIKLLVTNGSPTKKITYRGWSLKATDFDSDRASSLEDEHGNSYRAINFGLGQDIIGQADNVSLYPGKSAEDLLVYELPVPAAKELRLTLPGEAIGESGVIRFRIPIDDVVTTETLRRKESEEQAKRKQPKVKPKSRPQTQPQSEVVKTPVKREPAFSPLRKSDFEPETKAADSTPQKVDPEIIERKAAAKLRLANQFYDKGKYSDAKSWYREIVEEYPDTKAAKDAQKKLDAMK